MHPARVACRSAISVFSQERWEYTASEDGKAGSRRERHGQKERWKARSEVEVKLEVHANVLQCGWVQT